ncbi:baculoviral IAP repeat-containing protein 7-like isoform X3 [Petromyzon marinus]|uniref:baculoviral IAP repeat-containing protein 7-like isoform X3 n=1 Tax=Petromyzon marinus TaxID=7757 RepID=UPI003F720280
MAISPSSMVNPLLYELANDSNQSIQRLPHGLRSSLHPLGVLKVKKESMSFPIDDLSKHIYRLGRFVNCPSNLEPRIRDLAKAGFFYTGKEDKVECFSCKGVIGNWKSGDSAIAKHLQSFPNCTFARSLAQATDTQTSGGASVPRHIVAATNNASEITHHHSLPPSIGMNEPPMQNTLTSLPNVEAGVPSNSEMCVEANRLLSFSTWPESSPVRPADLARAGLYYVGPNDRVACFYCSGVMRDWEEGDVPAKEHERHFSTCAFAMGSSNTGNIPLAQAQQASFLPDTQNSACSASMARTTRARNPEMHSVVARLATYQAWPSTANVAAQPLAIAGFYYTGHGDNVKCFHCDGGLRNWEQGDNPWYEHGKWFPRCAFLLQQKGEAFVNEIMRQHPQLIDLTGEVFRQRSQNAAAQNGNGIGSTDETLMKSDVVKGVLEMGFLAPMVESLVRTRYLTKGETYSSVVELVTDVLNAEEGGESPKKSANYVQEQQKSAAEKKELKSEESLPPEEELKRLQEQHTCKVCMDKEVSVVFIPCGHLVVCRDCASSLRKCPICRAVVRGTVRTFMS